MALIMGKNPSSVVLVLVCSTLFLVPSVSSLQNGIDTGTTGGNGCFCHGAQTEDVTPSLAVFGDVGAIVEGDSYALEVSLTGGPAEAGENYGGFLVSVDSGSFAAPDADVAVDGDEATHTTAGNDQRSWQIEWTAGSADVAEFTLRTNSVNGDGGSTGDQWNMATFYLNADGSITQTLIGPAARIDDATMQTGENVIILSCILLMGVLSFLSVSKKSRGRRGEF